jgi:Nucleotidyltransferase domain
MRYRWLEPQHGGARSIAPRQDPVILSSTPHPEALAFRFRTHAAVGADSDVDVLMEFERGNVPGLFALSGMEAELPELLGRKADVRIPEELSRYFRDEVLRTAAAQYECE